jgi:hypothetical protein
MCKSFLLLFFKKEDLSFCLLSIGRTQSDEEPRLSRPKVAAFGPNLCGGGRQESKKINHDKHEAHEEESEFKK